MATEEVKFPCKMVMNNSDYHASSAVGSSDLKLILRSPAHYKYEKENPSDPTPAMQFGTACHQAILEPKLFEQAVVMPEFSGTGSRAKKEAWKLENHGKMIVKGEQRDDIRGILQAISKHKTARGLLSGGAAEEAYFWQDEETGIICKCKPDFLRHGCIVVDPKTTFDAEPKAFSRQIATLGYHLSGAFYLEGVTKVLGQKHDQFINIAIEKSAPYGISVHLLDIGTIDAGRFLYKKALKILKECRDKNEWPAYPDAILNTAIPAYAFPHEETV